MGEQWQILMAGPRDDDLRWLAPLEEPSRGVVFGRLSERCLGRASSRLERPLPCLDPDRVVLTPPTVGNSSGSHWAGTRAVSCPGTSRTLPAIPRWRERSSAPVARPCEGYVRQSGATRLAHWWCRSAPEEEP